MNNTSIGNWNDRFAIPAIAQIVPGNGGLPKVQITSSAASAEIYLHGAQLTSWQPAGSEEVIFLSQQSHWEEGRAIRGGIPICFPWFRAKSDDAKAPAHGFVRTKAWKLEALTQEQDSVVITLATESDAESRKWWPFDFRLVHRITVGAELKLELIVSNTGSAPFHFEEALHTYNRVGDATNLRIAGLDGVAFLDNRDANKQKLQSGDVLLTQATDNAYLNTQSPVEIVDPVLKRRIRLEKQNSLTTVVWNPWQEDAAKLADLGDDEWRQMACVEASNILSGAVTLAPGKEHAMTAMIHVINNSAV
ncbi:D-hexose-6-phosphate mutarotase [Acidicapsa acidisoli]|uniref:D-hexose-6-phosphate mutarotase n=1 Tax=Acidicapsa acidisoli TaxID=1615681 RepID=UPI0021E0E3BE|nr:D-hexose-6-phosphate mutarotase [Acidicapsa acidisoli]